jgi:hypothetical protein
MLHSLHHAPQSLNRLSLPRNARFATYAPTHGPEVSGVAFPAPDGRDLLFLPEGECAGWHCDLDDVLLHGYVADVMAQDAADSRPLWAQLADPSYYNGSASHGTLAGKGR